jgi:hypothetical protein
MQTRKRVENVSPELALVDEQLRPARHTLHETTPKAAPTKVAGRPREPRKPTPNLTLWGGVLTAAATIVTVLLLLGNDEPAPTAKAPSTRTAKAPSTAATVGAQQVVLRWKPTAGARLYNVILWRNGTRVLDLWPTEPSARVPIKRLEPGSYQWFVYPLLGKASDARYGRVIARGTVKV